MNIHVNMNNMNFTINFKFMTPKIVWEFRKFFSDVKKVINSMYNN